LPNGERFKVIQTNTSADYKLKYGHNYAWIPPYTNEGLRTGSGGRAGFHIIGSGHAPLSLTGGSRCSFAAYRDQTSLIHHAKAATYHGIWHGLVQTRRRNTPVRNRAGDDIQPFAALERVQRPSPFHASGRRDGISRSNGGTPCCCFWSSPNVQCIPESSKRVSASHVPDLQ
jgi:hypothetical protein